AQDELRALTQSVEEDAADSAGSIFQIRFYRFLDSTGAVIKPGRSTPAGVLAESEEAQLALPSAPHRQQTGYLFRTTPDGRETIDEIMAMPIHSKETGQVIAAAVLGFKPIELEPRRPGADIKRGIWLNGRLQLPGVPSRTQSAVGDEIFGLVRAGKTERNSFRVKIDQAEYLLFYQQLNPGSLFPPAYEVCIYPLTGLVGRQRELQWQILAAGVALFLGGFGASDFIARRFSRPVEKLAVESAEDRAQRVRAEAALETTSEELQRAARFSADASHQLKTPVTVLRAGLEELNARENLSAEARDEVAALVHQTFRITNIIEDLLLLSRMDAGRLQLEFSPVDLTLAIESWLDDHSAIADGLDLKIDTDLPADLHIEGEKRYTMLILQNLLENARKYNLPGGRIRISARADDDWVWLTIGNTSHPIAPAAREHIFERFHRGTIGENVPGYGLGLNLARELARIHGGDLRLRATETNWTEFEVRFRRARKPAARATQLA
ncbi:MAG TPA: HAMP domain-containing sensor histidine kinase, partial [Chthoniobacterales bacterium]|nr:HAMP domain-containing sensor histidine kinase [Chthoniobacterales bacterium]